MKSKKQFRLRFTHNQIVEALIQYAAKKGRPLPYPTFTLTIVKTGKFRHTAYLNELEQGK